MPIHLIKAEQVLNNLTDLKYFMFNVGDADERRHVPGEMHDTMCPQSRNQRVWARLTPQPFQTRSFQGI